MSVFFIITTTTTTTTITTTTTTTICTRANNSHLEKIKYFINKVLLVYFQI